VPPAPAQQPGTPGRPAQRANRRRATLTARRQRLHAGYAPQKTMLPLPTLSQPLQLKALPQRPMRAGPRRGRRCCCRCWCCRPDDPTRRRAESSAACAAAAMAAWKCPEGARRQR
jgi:hypothetical protein